MVAQSYNSDEARRTPAAEFMFNVLGSQEKRLKALEEILNREFDHSNDQQAAFANYALRNSTNPKAKITPDNMADYGRRVGEFPASVQRGFVENVCDETSDYGFMDNPIHKASRVPTDEGREYRVWLCENLPQLKGDARGGLITSVAESAKRTEYEAILQHVELITLSPLKRFMSSYSKFQNKDYLPELLEDVFDRKKDQMKPECVRAVQAYLDQHNLRQSLLKSALNEMGLDGYEI